MIQKTSGSEAMGHLPVKEWFRGFREGQTSVKSDECVGWSSMSRNQLMIDKVCSAMLGNRRITIRELSDKLGFHLVQYSSLCQKIWA
jgi:hypothetical protein